MPWPRQKFKPRNLGRGAHAKPKADADLTLDGYRFDSLSEKSRYATLRLLERNNLIRGLKVHPKLSMWINGRKIGRGYILLDFQYEEFKDGAWRMVYEDHKPVIDRNSKTRLQVCEAIHDIDIRLTQ